MSEKYQKTETAISDRIAQYPRRNDNFASDFYKNCNSRASKVARNERCV